MSSRAELVSESEEEAGSGSDGFLSDSDAEDPTGAEGAGEAGDELMALFVAPVSGEEELVGDAAEGVTSWRVLEECPLEELGPRLEAFRDQLVEAGSVALTQSEHFAALFAALRHFDELGPETRREAWKRLLGCLRRLGEDVGRELGQDAPAAQRRLRVNAVAMLLYLLSAFARKVADKFVTIARTAAADPITGKGGRRRKKGADQDGADIRGRAEDILREQRAAVMPEGDWDWAHQRKVLVDKLSGFLRVRGPGGEGLPSLWGQGGVPDGVTEGLVQLWAKLLEEPGLKKVEAQGYREALGEFFEALLVEMGRAEGLGEASVAVLQSAEAADEILDKVVGECLERGEREEEGAPRRRSAREYVDATLRCLGNLGTEALQAEGSTRQYGKFMEALATRSPTAFFPAAHHVTPYLSGDVWNLRSSILATQAELLIRLIPRDSSITDQQRERRQHLLDRLSAHVHDVNSFVRREAIKLWARLYSEPRTENPLGAGAIPMGFLKEIFPRITGRLSDKSPIVRKEALKFIRAFLQDNPYSGDLRKESLGTELDEARRQLAELREEAAPDSPATLAAIRWERKEPHVDALLRTLLQTRIDEEDQERRSQQDQPRVKEEPMDEDEAPAAPAVAFGLSDAVMKAWRKGERKIGRLLRAGEPEDLTDWDGSVDDESVKRALEKVWELRKAHPKLPAFEGWDETTEELPERVGRVTKLFRAAYVRPFEDKEGEERAAEAGPSQSSVNTAEAEEDRERDTREAAVKVRHLADAKWFADTIQRVLESVLGLLKSQQTSDVVEAVEFVVTCHEFGLLGAEAAVRRLSGLIWRKDQSVKDKVIESFKHLYIDTARGDAAEEEAGGGAREVEAERRVARSLMRLVEAADASERASLEEVVGQLVKQNILSKAVLDLLWTFADPDKIPQSASREKIGAALSLLAMAAKVDRGIVSQRLHLLARPALWERARQDFHFGLHICSILEKMGQKTDLKDQESIAKEPRRFGHDYELLKELDQLVLEGFPRTEDQCWVPMMEKAMNVVFHLAESPEELCQSWLLKCGAQLREASGEAGRRSALLVRWFSLVGHLAIRILVHIDVAYTAELKRRHLLMEKERSRSQRHDRSLSNPRRSLLGEHNGSANDSLNVTHDEGEEDILGNQGAVEDVQSEKISQMMEEEVLRPEAPLAQAGAFVLKFLEKDKWLRISPPVFAAAATALAKLLLISSKWTEPQLRLFFTLLSSEKVPAAVRDVLVIASGDLSVRFPNLVEPYKKFLYGRLEDADPCVEQTCMLVLTHLILNDMVQPKGYMASIALKITSENARMAGLALTFFDELAQKGDKVNRHMADIISQLSVLCSGDRERFQKIMKRLMKHVKEANVAGQVQKLCQRFKAGTSAEEAENFAFCLAQLPVLSGEGLERLETGLDGAGAAGDAGYGQFLHLPEVYTHFSHILAAAKAAGRNEERREALGELEEVFERRREAAGELTEDERRRQRKSLESARQRAAAAKGPRGRPKGQAAKRASPAKAPRGRPKRTRGRRPAELSDYDDDQEDDDF